MVTDLKTITKDDWLKSMTVNMYKGKGDALEHDNFRSHKLLDTIMKVTESQVNHG